MRSPPSAARKAWRSPSSREASSRTSSSAPISRRSSLPPASSSGPSARSPATTAASASVRPPSLYPAWPEADPRTRRNSSGGWCIFFYHGRVFLNGSASLKGGGPLRPILALNIKNREVEELAAEVAMITGESKTEAIRKALAQRRQRLARQGRPQARAESLRRLLAEEIWPLLPPGER